MSMPREMRGPLLVERFYDWAFGVPRKYHQRRPDWFWRIIGWPEHRFFCHHCAGIRKYLKEES